MLKHAKDYDTDLYIIVSDQEQIDTILNYYNTLAKDPYRTRHIEFEKFTNQFNSIELNPILRISKNGGKLLSTINDISGIPASILSQYNEFDWDNPCRVPDEKQQKQNWDELVNDEYDKMKEVSEMNSDTLNEFIKPNTHKITQYPCFDKYKCIDFDEHSEWVIRCNSEPELTNFIDTMIHLYDDMYVQCEYLNAHNSLTYPLYIRVIKLGQVIDATLQSIEQIVSIINNTTNVIGFISVTDNYLVHMNRLPKINFDEICDRTDGPDYIPIRCNSHIEYMLLYKYLIRACRSRGRVTTEIDNYFENIDTSIPSYVVVNRLIDGIYRVVCQDNVPCNLNFYNHILVQDYDWSVSPGHHNTLMGDYLSNETFNDTISDDIIKRIKFIRILNPCATYEYFNTDNIDTSDDDVCESSDIPKDPDLSSRTDEISGASEGIESISIRSGYGPNAYLIPPTDHAEWTILPETDCIIYDYEHADTTLYDTINKEENIFMKFNIEFGEMTKQEGRLSLYGIAVKDNINGDYKSYDPVSKSIIDVTDMLYPENMNEMVIKMPVATSEVSVGDSIAHNGTPVYVTEVLDDDKFKVINVITSEESVILPVKNAYGFNFMTKYISMLGAAQAGGTLGMADNNNPFGNMLPMLMMSKSGDNESSDGMNPMMMMAAMSTMTPASGQNNIMNNPMMLMALSGNGSSDMSDIMKLMAMQQMMVQQPLAVKPKTSTKKSSSKKTTTVDNDAE